MDSWRVPVLFCLLLGNEGLEKRDTLLVLSACAPLPGVIGLIELLRSWQSGMWELEEACRYHLQQIQGMRLLVLGITDSAGTAVVFAAGLLNGYRAGMLLLFFCSRCWCQTVSSCCWQGSSGGGQKDWFRCLRALGWGFSGFIRPPGFWTCWTCCMCWRATDLYRLGGPSFRRSWPFGLCLRAVFK